MSDRPNIQHSAIVSKDSTVKFTDTTTGNVTTDRHGYVPKGTNTGTKFLKDDTTWAIPNHDDIDNNGTTSHADLDTHVGLAKLNAHGNNADDTIVLPKTSGKGIKVDTTSPTFGWTDWLGVLAIKVAGASDPTWATTLGTDKDWKFSNVAMNEMWINYHVPHDYVPGSDIFIHVHWSQITVDTGGAAGAPGDVKWYFDVTYAKGHNQAAFPAQITTSVVQTASETQYQHMIAEVQLSAAAPSASQLDSDNIEADGLIKVRIYRDAADVADTLDQNPFLHCCDIHAQSTGIGTKAKAPGFWT